MKVVVCRFGLMRCSGILLVSVNEGVVWKR